MIWFFFFFVFQIPREIILDICKILVMSICILCQSVYTERSICSPCNLGATRVVSLINSLQDNQKFGGDRSGSDNTYVNSRLDRLSSSSDVFANCLRWINEMKDTEEELKDKLVYLGGFVDAFKDQIHTDIQVLPGDNGSPIHAHRALLATRSNIFKNMLCSDGIMAQSSDKIALPEFTYEELKCLLEFLYSGHLSKAALEKHITLLSIAADKYEIPFLAKLCEKQLLTSLNPNNALEVLEISHTCSMLRLKELALNFVVKNMDEIVFSAKFDAFVLKNPHLSVEITRASFKESKRNSICPN